MERYATEPVYAEVMDDEISIVDVQRIRRFHYKVHLRLMKRIKGETYRNHEVLIPELVVPTPQILKELAKYFKRVTLVDPDRKAPTDETEELFFVCQQPR